MNEEQAERLIEAVERVAKALETANYVKAFQPSPTTYPPSNMWQCGVCQTWVMSGVHHSCNGKVSFSTWGAGG